MNDDLKQEAERLDPLNRRHVYGVMGQLAKLLNLTKGDRVELDLMTPYKSIWEIEGVKSLSTPKIREIKRGILNYLHEIDVLTISDAGLSATVYVDRNRFFVFYEILKSHELKRAIDDTTRIIKTQKIIAANKSESEIVYKIEFKDGVILLNNLYLTKPQYGSINYDVFDFLYKSANKRHDVQALMASLNQQSSKTIHQILNDLGFKDDMKLFFFPNVSTRYIEFINPITSSDIKTRGLGLLKVEIGRKNQKNSRNNQIQ